MKTQSIADGRRFVTSAKLAETKSGKSICQTFATNFASQCGYCTPGQSKNPFEFYSRNNLYTELSQR